MMKTFRVNWKTTSAGVAAILAALAGGLTAYSTGHLDGNTIGTVVLGVMGGIGLLYAKDGDVTGGTVPATPEAAKRV